MGIDPADRKVNKCCGFQGVAAIDNIAALSIGQRFIDYCAAGRPFNVISVFDNAANLRAGGEILTIASNEAGRSPSSLTVHRASCLRLAIGETCSHQPGRIRFRDSVVDYSQSPVWSGRVGATYRQKLSWESVCALNLALCRGSPPPGALCHGSLPHAAQRHGSPPSMALHTGQDSPLNRGIRKLTYDPENGVRELIGLGPGLTPSGDDVIVGFIAVLNHYSDDTRHLRLVRDAVTASLRATTDLSAQLLRNAIRFEYHEYIEDVLISLCDTPETVNPSASRLLGVGATSGLDIASGMYHAAVFLTRGGD